MKIPLQLAKELSDEEDTVLVKEIPGVQEILELTFVEATEWDDEGKYQYQDIIFKADDKHYMFTIGRSGSYFSHYEYDFSEDNDRMVECVEVTKKTKTIEYWG